MKARRGVEPDAFATIEPELRALLGEVDALYAHHSCPGSAECCKFGITGREPYVTSIEAELVARGIARAGKTVASLRARSASGRRRALPIAREGKDAPTNVDAGTRQREGWCLLLTDDGRCSVYADRPLGCRTFYCDRAIEGRKVKQKEVNELVRRVKDLALRYDPPGARGPRRDEGVPLGRALDAR